MTHTEYTILCNEVNRLNDQYYKNHISEVPDNVFDFYLHQIEEAEAEHPEWVTLASPTQHVGNDAVEQNGFKKIAHSYPMLSLQDIYTEDDVRKFVANAKDEFYSVECKLDGLSLSLTYERGQLVRAVTRGNGSEGDDVTAQAKCIPSIPQTLQYWDAESTEIRGEVVMPFEAFERYNAENPDNKFANPRNAASGTLKSYDPNKCCERGLVFVAYFVKVSPCSGITQQRNLRWLEHYGFNTPNTYNGVRQVASYGDTYCVGDMMKAIYEVKQTEYPFPIDGVVIKVNSPSKIRDLGYTDKFYKWGIAFKFKQESLRSRLIQVNWQLAESGRVTPVAIYEPIEMFGTTCQRATLNNPDWIEKNLPGIRIGDTLLLTKGGEIIPKVTGFVPHELTQQEKTRELVMPRSWKEHIDGNGVNDTTLIIQTSGVVVPPDAIGGRETYRQGAYLMARLNEDEQPKPKKPACPVAARPATVPCGSPQGSTRLQGKTILVSGNFGTPKIRKDIEAAVIANGGKLAKGVTDSVTYYVLPDDLETWKHKAGGKWLKIQENCHQNRIITKNEFYRLIEE